MDGREARQPRRVARASEAEGPGGGVKDTWIQCVPMVHSRCKVTSSRSIRRGTLSSCREREILWFHGQSCRGR